MKIRIRKKRKTNGKVWYIPERRVIPLIWRKISVREFFSKVLYRFPDKTFSNEYKYELTEPFDGYVYFLRQDLAEKYMGLYALADYSVLHQALRATEQEEPEEENGTEREY